MNEFTEFVDLASERLGGRVVSANDEFFAPKSNLLKSSKPIFIEGKFTTRGKWMDGWETRRRRTPGFDWCLIRLGLPGIVRGIVVDTSFFKGNYPEQFSLDGCDLGVGPPFKNEKSRLESSGNQWSELLPQTALQGDSQNMFVVATDRRCTHLRLRIFPDGGVARLRVHGEVVPNETATSKAEIDLAALQNGARVMASSDRFFGEPMNLLLPCASRNMGDGWETRRRRGPGHDWVVVKLGVPGIIRKIEVNTAHFKGNFPANCSFEACRWEGTPPEGVVDGSQEWTELLPVTPLKANQAHIFQTLPAQSATHVRFNIYPDGGVARLRLFGLPDGSLAHPKGIEHFNQLPNDTVRKLLLDCCGSRAWTEQMLAHKPFSSLKHLLDTADRAWAELGKQDWLEAFRHHPPIGAKKANEHQSEKAQALSSAEQSAAQKSPRENLQLLAEANQAYESSFGHVFLICATGKTSEEILKSLQQRLRNDRETELRNAAEEQRKITRLRLQKLVGS